MSSYISIWSAFRGDQVSVVDLVELIPHLLSYSKYSLERYEDVFVKYQQVLGKLVEYLNSTHSSHPRLREEAKEYSLITAIFLNKTIEQQAELSAKQTPLNVNDISSFLDRKPESHEELTQEQVIDNLRVQFNKTLTATQQLFIGLEGFQRDIAELIQKGDKSVFKLTLAQSKLNGTAVVVKTLGEISASGLQVWDQLVNYGFWFITSLLTTPISEIVAKNEQIIAQIANLTQVVKA
jgi:hypothetical protein